LIQELRIGKRCVFVRSLLGLLVEVFLPNVLLAVLEGMDQPRTCRQLFLAKRLEDVAVEVLAGVEVEASSNDHLRY